MSEASGQNITAETQTEQASVRTLDGNIQVEGLTVGDMLELENKGEYVCFRKMEDEGKEYLFLMSKRKPKELIIAEEIVDKGLLSVKALKDPEKKAQLLKRYKRSPFTTLRQLIWCPKRRQLGQESEQKSR